MKKIINYIIITLLLIILSSSAYATKLYMTDTDITSQTGGSRYWAASSSPGDGAAATTRVSLKQGNPGSNFFRPGQSAPEGTSSMSDTPKGYGWATDFVLGDDIPVGTWNFKVTTKNSRSEDSGGRVIVYVFEYCNGANTKLFSVQGTTEIASSTSDIVQTISSSQPAFTTAGCRLKFEYWVTISNVAEDTSNNLQKIATSDFYVDFPGSENPPPPSCADSDNDGYTSSSCGGNDCNDNNQNIHPGATETCNNADDNCNGQTDEGLSKSATCGVGACLNTITQTCSAGQFLPACTPGNPTTEVCGNSIDEDCNGQLDNGCACSPGQTQSCGTDVGICVTGVQTCLQNSSWGNCVGTVLPVTEICANNLDDNCNGQTDENCACVEGEKITLTCGSGECKKKITQTCTNGILEPICTPGTPSPEICNGKDDNCNNITDDGIAQIACGSDIGECKKGLQSCVNGKLSDCKEEILPNQEICDLKDNDCDLKIDEEDVCKTNTTISCSEEWTCSEWTNCTEILSTRNCSDKNSCNTTRYMPALKRLCRNDTSSPSSQEEESFTIADDRPLLFGLLSTGAVVFISLGYLFSFRKEIE